MNTTRIFAVFSLTLLMVTTLSAQPPGGGRDGGGRGGDRGGGFRGGGPGGGPPGGGFRGGGPPGGDRGSRGSFDAASMLSRLDANGNGVLDPEEQQGPAQFLIGRMRQSDPSIQPGKPIPLKKISEGFEKMRQQREQGQSSGNASRGGSAADEALMPELLVEGFGFDDEPVPLLGFGAAAEMLSVVITDDDKREASERMRRYDRNGDGYLTKNELSSRFAGNPMDFDRNKDGKLSESELAVRYARRREGEEDARRDRAQDRGEPERRGSEEPPDVYSGRKSYRVDVARSLPEGLPGFFSDKDGNQDGQVTMAEFSDSWDATVIAEFFRSDLNADGVITVVEAMRAVELGGSQQASMTSVSTDSGSSSTASSTPAATEKPDEKLVAYAKRIIERNDTNKDNALTASEWKSMLLSPAAADADRDGRITIDEYALWMQSRSK